VPSSATPEATTCPALRVSGNTVIADVVIYSATPSGIAAAAQAAAQGESVALIEPTAHIGGMSASGVSVADVGAIKTIGGLARRFFDIVDATYGTGYPLANSGRAYAAHIAEKAFAEMLPSCNFQLMTNAELVSVNKSGTVVTSIVTSSGKTISGKVFVDASYTGDLLAAAGVDSRVGREANSEYAETDNGVGSVERMIGQFIDPYVVPADPKSGLLPHVSSVTLQPKGEADGSVMAYNYRLCFTNVEGNKLQFTPPDGYDPAEFEVLARLSESLVKNRLDHHPPFNYFLTLAPIPDGKFDVNTAGTFSTDYVGMSAAYPNADLTTRRAIDADHRRYTQGLLYFLLTSPRIPDYIRAELTTYGLCKDEYVDNGGWPYRLYVREARRMLGDYVITEADIAGTRAVPDSIGIGSYYYDSHHYNRVVQGGSVVMERNANSMVTPYPISYRALVPKASDSTNLLVSVAVSASHSAFTSIRVEPTFMIMGQAAGAAAAIAAAGGLSVQAVPYQQLAHVLQSSGQIVTK
jgi:ribulose 1,5-bisphosphate synthetase/thiazole synthase